MSANSRAKERAFRRVRTMALAPLLATLLIPEPAAPVRAAAIVGALPMSCPISVPWDVAVIGADTIVLGLEENPQPQTWDAVLCRIEPSGAAAWTTTIPDAYSFYSGDHGKVALAAGPSGIYVGWAVVDANVQRHARIRRFAMDGTVQETATTASGGDDVVEDIAVAPDGRVYLLGSTTGHLGDAPPTPGQVGDGFVRAFEPTLSVRWTNQLHATVTGPYDMTPRDGYVFGAAIAADASGVYVTGAVKGSIPGVPPSWADGGFVRQYSTSGTVMWSRQFEVLAYASDIAASAQGIHVVGQSSPFGDRDPDRRFDAFQRLFDRNGNVLWTREIGGVNDDAAFKVLPDAAGSIVFGDAPEGLGAGGPAAGSVFLARFGPTGVPGPVTEFPRAWWQTGAKVTSDGSTVRIASVVPPEWPSPDPGPYVIPPKGTNLIRFDAMPPTVGPPSVHAIAKSEAGTTTAPLTAAWAVSDGASSITSIEVQVSKDGGAWTSLPGIGPATRSATTSGRMGGTIRVRVRATDATGNIGEWTYGPTVTLSLVQETSSSIKESSSWRRRVKTGALGGYVDWTKVHGAWARYTFTGSAVAWVSSTGPTRGQANVYIDGKYVATIDTYSAAYVSRKIVFERSWTVSGTHTFEVHNKATSSRPRIDLDALLILR